MITTNPKICFQCGKPDTARFRIFFARLLILCANRRRTRRHKEEKFDESKFCQVCRAGVGCADPCRGVCSLRCCYRRRSRSQGGQSWSDRAHHTNQTQAVGLLHRRRGRRLRDANAKRRKELSTQKRAYCRRHSRQRHRKGNGHFSVVRGERQRHDNKQQSEQQRPVSAVLLHLRRSARRKLRRQSCRRCGDTQPRCKQQFPQHHKRRNLPDGRIYMRFRRAD